MGLKLELGKRIKELRELNKFSQETLAELIGINRNSLSKIENGDTYPKPENLEKLKEVLNVEFKDFFTFGDSKNDKLDNINMKLLRCDKKELDFVNILIDTMLKNKV